MNSKRLSLEIFAKNEFKLFQEINNNEFVRKYLWDNELISEDLSKEVIEESLRRFETEKWGLWKVVLSESKECVGYAGLWYFFDEEQAQLLYALLPEYTGKGYALEAAMQIVAYAFQELEFAYITASMDKANSKSIALCKKLGMELIDERTIEGKAIIFYEKKNKS